MSDIDLDSIEREAQENIAVCEAEIPADVVPEITRHDRIVLALCARVREQEQEIARLKERAKRWVCPDCGRDSRWDGSEYKGRDASA